LHPPAPFAAAPALLEACGYSICLVLGWQPRTFRGGAPACPFGRVCLQLAACPVNPLVHLRRFTGQVAVLASSTRLSPSFLAMQTCLSYSCIEQFLRALHGTSLCAALQRRITQQPRSFFLYLSVSQFGESMPASTPIARSKTAALSRILDSIPKGYCRYVFGQVKAEKGERLIRKLHERHAIGATPAQRITRKKKGKANAILVIYWPDGVETVQWLMLFTRGELDFPEQLGEVTDKPRLAWLGYELVRHPARGVTSWTWRRPKAEMRELYSMLRVALAMQRQGDVAEALARIANQPGFHGVRQQSWALCQHARHNGYSGELPHLFFLQKVSHGDLLMLV